MIATGAPLNMGTHPMTIGTNHVTLFGFPHHDAKRPDYYVRKIERFFSRIAMIEVIHKWRADIPAINTLTAMQPDEFCFSLASPFGHTLTSNNVIAGFAPRPVTPSIGVKLIYRLVGLTVITILGFDFYGCHLTTHRVVSIGRDIRN